MKNLAILAISFLMTFGQTVAQNQKTDSTKMNNKENTEHYTFQLSDKVTR